MMFYRLERLEYLKIPDTWDFSGVGDSENGLLSMFGSFGKRATAPVLDVSGMNVSGVHNLHGLFVSAGVSELDLSNWVLNDEVSIVGMFDNCPNLTTIYVSYDWGSSEESNAVNIFENCTSLVGGAGTVYDSTAYGAQGGGYNMARIDGGPSNPGYFTYKAPSN